MPMKWHHGETISQVVALRRAHGRLHAVARCDLEPAELQLLTDNHGDLRWSTSTDNRRRDPLQIIEISLTPRPASIGLPAVRWWKLDVVKGEPPPWVREELDRADKTEYRSRGECVSTKWSRLWLTSPASTSKSGSISGCSLRAV